ncbi:hypothetical protein CHGG_09240 [Chaetomium globosum CBS 148.51]|uniref:Reverse transcriptase domain-containing protein n=1 Tax=Chaetomium globosum (strain ATCC 6205 / CBS 148.51 / DSM 1962 / NBRC 6347 / NRRL 1970) TaxID=306901 RepID=Q2GS14_CHAGB|nr:uncharacterized protein CHGG_09240 [Chaetomium globosum CBS 148.51]EAQ85226.1 hypothetical protein CHGG_09240 [Chaetomium globosum CBS 148.51]
MAAEAQPQIVVEVADQPPSPRRPSRALKPSAKAREAMQSLEDVATTSRRAASETTRAVTTRGARASGILYGANSRIETGKSGIQMLLEAINEQRDEMYRMITEQRNTIGELREVICKQHDAIQELHRQLADTRTQLSEELRQARDQIDTLQRHPVAMASSQPSARGSYAEVARTPPSSQPSGVRTLSSRNTTPSSFTDTLFCTIDTSRVEEKEKGNVQVADIRKAIETEARAQESMGDWRCAAVVKEARNPDRVRVICRDEGEVQLVKEAAVKISVPGVRRSSMRTGNILPGAAEALGTENDVNIAKIAWLSRKDTSKAYGSMVVYVTKGSEARRLLDGRYFHLVGECRLHDRFSRPPGRPNHSASQDAQTLKILQLNVRKRREVQQSLLNDEGLKDFAVLAISEPYARLIEGSVTTVPMSHHNWTKLIPTTRREATWPIRSMLWVRSRYRGRADSSAVGRPHRSTHSAPRSGSADGVSQTNYSDARFTSCDHGSDHRAIETAFDTSVEDRPSETRFLFKNAPWAEIRTRVAANLERIPWDGNVQQQTDRLMAAVTEAVYGLTPKAKPSPYAKRCTRARTTSQDGRPKSTTTPSADRRVRIGTTSWPMTLTSGQATKYLQTGSGTMGDKIPPLVRPDGSITEGKAEQAQELLTAFFPPLPARIEDEGQRPQRAPVHMPDLTMEEIEQKVLSAKPWKAPGEDGLPAMVWRQLWPVVKDRVLHLFRTSLRDGDIPSQWKNAKIIPLKKPGKSDYTLAKSWRPISLLSTLGKILEAVIAERLSHAVETCGLLPANHFGARKRRSTEQALLLLQEHIYKAWRARKVLSLISFDVKGAYNGVFKDRLLQRLKARGIPEPLVKWIDAFCSKRTATIAVNGFTSGRQELPQAGLPQGSPLSPVLRSGPWAITGAFRTAATAVVEAEASIYPVRERHVQAAASLWINIHTLPGTHPLAMKKVRTTVRFVSPLQKIARVAEGVRVDRMETIQEYAVPPWVPRLRPTLEADRGKAAEMVNKISGIVIATSSSVKKGIVGMGGLARDTLFNRTSETVTNYAVVLGTREEQNPYTAELAAIAMALEKLPASICHRHITVITRNQSALAAVGQPRQQSGQSIIRQIYDLARLHRQRGNSVNFLWIPAEIDFALGSDAKAAAQRASKQGRTPDSQIPQAKSTAMRLAMERQRATRVLPVSVGKFSKAMDAALPGKHTRHLYDKLKRREACVLAQLRTGMARLNGFLSRIGAVESDLCACGQARESVEHFLFRCLSDPTGKRPPPSAVKPQRESSNSRSIATFFNLNANNAEDQRMANHLISAFDRAEFQRRIVRWLISANLPFRTAEHPYLRDVFSYLNPSVDIQKANLSEKTVHALAVREVERHKDAVVKTLQESPGLVHLVFDGWTSRNRLSLYGVSAVFRDEEGTPHKIVLGLPEMSDRHTGENIAEAILDVIRNYGIEKKIGYFTVDNATNNDAALKIIECDAFEREVSTSLLTTQHEHEQWRRKGPIGGQQVRPLDQEAHLGARATDPRSLRSLFYETFLFEAKLHVDSQFRTTAGTLKKGAKEPLFLNEENKLTANDWEVISVLKEILLDFELVVKALQGDGQPREKKRSSCDEPISLLDKYYEKIGQSPLIYAAHRIAPSAPMRVGSRAWREHHADWIEPAKLQVRELWRQQYRDLPVEQKEASEPPTKIPRLSSNRFAIFRTQERTPTNSAPTSPSPFPSPALVELDEFERWQLDNSDFDRYEEDPRAYWHKRRNTYPRLARMALDLHTVLPMSAEVERLVQRYWPYGLLPLRNRLQANTISLCQILRSWYDAGVIDDLDPILSWKTHGHMEDD